MGTVCSRCRRGSTSSSASTENCGNHFSDEPNSQRPQSSFSLHNIDVLANDADSMELSERKTDVSNDESVQSANLAQRTSIENENASIENVTPDDSYTSPPMVKRKSSFSDCSSIVQSSECSTPSSNKSYEDIGKEIDPYPSGSEGNKEKNSSNESFVIPPRINVSINYTISYLTLINHLYS